MSQNPDLMELFVGLLRPAGWLLGAFICTRYKNWFAFGGCVIFIFTSTIASFANAGYDPIGENVVTYLSTPGVFLMVAGMAYSAQAILNFKRAAENLTVEDLTKER